MPGRPLPARRPLSLAAGTLLAGALALCGCPKISFLEDHPVTPWPTVVLMHRGGGSNPDYVQNTLPAVAYGCSVLDGPEVDIQLSADNTLWLGHDNATLDCAGNEIGCFQDLGDGQIDAVAYCDGAAPCAAGSTPTCQQHYVRLEEVMAFLATSEPTKTISLDIKGQYCKSLGVADAQHMANGVDRVVRQYGMAYRVLVETEQKAFLQRIMDNQTPVYSFVVSLGDIDGPLSEAANLGATGISFKYAPGSEPLDASVVAGIHQKGFRIIVWTIDAPADIQAVWPTRSDVIETDNPDFMSYVP